VVVGKSRGLEREAPMLCYGGSGAEGRGARGEEKVTGLDRVFSSFACLLRTNASQCSTIRL
jgi:hypothetical protein